MARRGCGPGRSCQRSCSTTSCPGSRSKVEQAIGQRQAEIDQADRQLLAGRRGQRREPVERDHAVDLGKARRAGAERQVLDQQVEIGAQVCRPRPSRARRAARAGRIRRSRRPPAPAPSAVGCSRSGANRTGARSSLAWPAARARSCCPRTRSLTSPAGRPSSRSKASPSAFGCTAPVRRSGANQARRALVHDRCDRDRIRLRRIQPRSGQMQIGGNAGQAQLVRGRAHGAIAQRPRGRYAGPARRRPARGPARRPPR